MHFSFYFSLHTEGAFRLCDDYHVTLHSMGLIKSVRLHNINVMDCQIVIDDCGAS